MDRAGQEIERNILKIVTHNLHSSVLYFRYFSHILPPWLAVLITAAVAVAGNTEHCHNYCPGTRSLVRLVMQILLVDKNTLID
jgi:hypothetical protein